MQPIGLFENLMAKIGPIRVIAAVVLDRPADTAAVLAGLAAAQRRLPRLRQRIAKRWGWRWRIDVEESLAAHVAVIDDPELADEDGLRRLLEMLDRSGFDDFRAPWRAILVNPRGSGGGLPAFILHCDHTIADGMRIERIMRGMAEWPAGDPQSAAIASLIAGTATRSTIAGLPAPPADDRTTRRDLAMLVVPADLLRRARRGRSATATLLAAMTEALEAEGVLAMPALLRGRALEIVGERRGGAETGNFVAARAVALPVRGAMARRRELATRLLAALGVRRMAWASLAPAPALRRFIAWWYRRFDTVIALTPSTRDGFTVGGAPVRRFFGVAPAITDVHVSITAVLSRGDCCMVISAGGNVRAGTDGLRDRFAAALAAMDPDGRHEPLAPMGGLDTREAELASPP